MLAVSSINLSSDKFRFVPLQDFTESSEIDWSKSVADIDRQLYAKYNLTPDEIAFIESMIKPMWLPSPEQAEQRVALRVASGGHNIPKDVIHRRYWRGIQNLFEIYVPIVDYWALYDNSDGLKLIVERNAIIDSDKYHMIKQQCQSKKK